MLEWCSVVTYLGLVAQTVAAVNPDVLSEDFAFLVKFHVLGQLQRVSQPVFRMRNSVTHVGSVGNNRRLSHGV